MAAATGLRGGELRRLRWCDIDRTRRWVTVPAASAKSRKDQGVPLRSDLLRALRRRRPPDAKDRDLVFPGRLFPLLRTFKEDLKAAGIPFQDELGRRVDFHALRVTFVSRLTQNGLHPRVAQALARHAKLETTMQVYTDLRLLDLRGAIESTVGDDDLL